MCTENTSDALKYITNQMDGSMCAENTVNSRKGKIIIVKNASDILFGRKSLVGIITVAFNNNYIAFAPNDAVAFVYQKNTHRDIIREIIRDAGIIKLISKPIPALESYLGCKGLLMNCEHIGSYIGNSPGTRMNERIIPNMKHEIIDQGNVKSSIMRSARVALIMMKYKIISDNITRSPKKSKRSFFNKKRDCYLIYLTVYNDFLSQYGPMKFDVMVSMAESYLYLCKLNMTPSHALEGLIESKAFILDHQSMTVMIPDQISP